MPPPSPSDGASGPSEFDAAGFADALAHARGRCGWSTRRLARAAGISQAYVVALERARGGGAGPAPTPTVEVVARLAHALDLDPTQLFRAGLRPRPRHVLLVTEDSERSSVDRAREMAGEIDRWVLAASARPDIGPTGPHRRIHLRRDAARAYDPALVADSLVAELRRLAAGSDRRPIGLVFAETSAIMVALDDPRTILALEHRWAAVVSDAATVARMPVAYNVCVYELGSLGSLPDPVEAAVELMRTHDTLWVARGDRVETGRAAAHRILGGLRPAGVGRDAWQATSERIVDGLASAA